MVCSLNLGCFSFLNFDFNVNRGSQADKLPVITFENSPITDVNMYTEIFSKLKLNYFALQITWCVVDLLLVTNNKT